jgi:hypothetical protein
LILKGKPAHIRQEFIVARTKRRYISLANLTGYEKEVVKQVSWFSLDRIIHSGEVIPPAVLPKYLPDIIAGKYPEEPLEIDLTQHSHASPAPIHTAETPAFPERNPLRHCP